MDMYVLMWCVLNEHLSMCVKTVHTEKRDIETRRRWKNHKNVCVRASEYGLLFNTIKRLN